MQFRVSLRNSRLAAILAVIGANPILMMRTGAKPASCVAADSGTVLSTVNLPTPWMNAPADGAMDMSAVWEDLAADAAGTAGHFRIYAADGVTCCIQGTVTATGGDGDMTVDNVVFAANQEFRITRFLMTEGNA